MADGSMITIKKPDGTIEKISLEDFKTRQKKPATMMAQPVAPAPALKAPSVEEGPKAPPKPLMPEEKVATAPAVSEKKATLLASVPRLDKSDAASLLDEETPPPATVAKPLIKPLGTPKTLMKEPDNILPSTSAPVNPFVHAAPQSLRPAVSPVSGNIKKPENIAPVRPFVRDIAPAKPSSLGPVDELEFFTLTDFRRLSSKADEAASRLKQKFINLRDESYILYLDGLAAWRQSPLFTEYSGVVVESLNNKKKLADVLLADKNKIQMPEVQAIIQMEKELL